jgi:hypothetical protein
VGAVLFAVAAISFAVAIRHGREADADRTHRRSAAESAYGTFDRGSVEAICIDELRSVCEDDLSLFGFDVRVEPAWATVDRVVKTGRLGADVWLTVRPFDAMASQPGRPAIGQATPVLGRTPIAVVGPPAATAGFDRACPDAATVLRCAATTYLPHIALRDPSRSAYGALALASVAYELGVPERATSIDDPAVLGQLRGLVHGGRTTQTPFDDVLRLRSDSLALTTESDLLADIIERKPDDQERYDSAAIRYPLDVRTAEVVAVPSATFSRAAELRAVLTSQDFGWQLEHAGYIVEGRTAYVLDLAPPLKSRPPMRTDLPPPDAGLLRALRAVGGS